MQEGKYADMHKYARSHSKLYFVCFCMKKNIIPNPYFGFQIRVDTTQDQRPPHFILVHPPPLFSFFTIRQLLLAVNIVTTICLSSHCFLLTLDLAFRSYAE